MSTRKVLWRFREVSQDITVGQILTFLTIAEKPGMTVTELGETVGTILSSTSRNISALGPWTRHKRPGLGLIMTRESLEDRRVKHVYLTVKGQRLYERIKANEPNIASTRHKRT